MKYVIAIASLVLLCGMDCQGNLTTEAQALAACVTENGLSENEFNSLVVQIRDLRNEGQDKSEIQQVLKSACDNHPDFDDCTPCVVLMIDYAWGL